jgi:hypothetical protein
MGPNRISCLSNRGNIRGLLEGRGWLPHGVRTSIIPRVRGVLTRIRVVGHNASVDVTAERAINNPAKFPSYTKSMVVTWGNYPAGKWK